jgi:uncharacterized lipoprotein YddW (UPF0748 family)
MQRRVFYALRSVPIIGICVLMASANALAEFDFRAIFADRFDFQYSTGNIPQMTANINAMMQNAADQGFNHVVWQVRGRGDALYNSNFEPHITNLTPGFDPLQVALDAAHSRGLKLHAWLNATPMWNTTAVNPPAGHIYHNNNPSFRLMDINGNLEPQQGWGGGYASVNPILPEVHAHINNVVNDIATNYDVDGIHLDYIRYIPGANNAAADFAQLPHDPISHQMFLDATGLNAGSSANFAAYKSYITGRITDLVASIKDTVDAAEVSEGRAMDLSASVWRDPDVGKNDYMQDYRTWIEQELLDVAMPMIYLSQYNDAALFNANLSNTLNILAYSGSSTKVAPNLASYIHVDNDIDNNPNNGLQPGGGVALTLSQMQRAYDGFGQGGTDGVGFYDFPAFFSGYTAAERQQIKDFFEAIDSPPQPPPPPGPGYVLDDFEVKQGHFGWFYGYSPQTVGFNENDPTATSVSRVVGEHQGLGVGSQLLNLVPDVSDSNANWELRHNSGIGVIAHPDGNVHLAPTGWVGFWLKTDDAAAGNVEIWVDDPVATGATAIERGEPMQIIADNQWHLYQWNLEDDNHWGPFNTGTNGAIDAVNGFISIDSIFITGSGNVQLYLDNVSQNPNAMLAALVPGDFDRDGDIDLDDYNVLSKGSGDTVHPGSGADGNNDGIVDAGDYIVWMKHYSALLAGSGNGAGNSKENSVPEPHVALLVVVAAIALASRRMSI